MSWRKHFKIWDPQAEQTNAGPRGGGSTLSSKFASWLQDVYTGQPNRVERYVQYDQMDQDSEVNAALDTIAEFCTQADDDTNLPFRVMWKEDPTESESKIVQESLKKWCAINKMDQRIFRIFRSAIKYGDHFFLRDPETFELYWVNPTDVKRAVINEAEGRAVEQYVIANIHPNLGMKVATKPIDNVNTLANSNVTNAAGPFSVASGYSKPNQGIGEIAISGEHVLHVSLNEGLDASWPFGPSILDSVFKIYKQKEMLEDAIIIYRVQRAPERRVFYIDTGNLPSHQAMAFVERVKNEIHQRRIPSRSGGSATMDASYNPLSIMEDFFFAQTADGRGSKVEVLPGGQNLGEIDDLKFFTNKLFRGLRIPSSYLPTGPDDTAVQFTDGRMGTALIQEFRFNRYCRRLQGLVAPYIDKEFKTFMKHRGVNIDSSSFDLDMLEPQNFSSYREIEINNARAAVFTQLAEIPYLAHRFKLKKFMGLTDDEILENEKLWREENDEDHANNEDESADFGATGLKGPSDSDLDLSGGLDLGPIEGEPGAEGAPPTAGAAPGGAPAPAPGGATPPAA
jgi:hypothetical protein